MKKMKKKYRRILSCFLALVLVMCSVPVTAIAETAEEETLTQEGETSVLPTNPILGEQTTENESAAAVAPSVNEYWNKRGEGEKSLAELQSMRVEDVKRPEMISLDTAREKGHVNRLHAQEEDLRTVIYQNRDGGKTTYIFAKPVKYVDESGNVRDKSSALTIQEDRSYAMLDNDTKAYFPKDLRDGVSVTYGDYRITMTPISDSVGTATVPMMQDGILGYNSVFGNGTVLLYETNLDGIKEDIVLVKNIGRNTFSFTLTSVGLTPICVEDEWLLQNSEGTVVGSFGKVIVEDSAGKSVVGEMSVTETATAGVYTMTLTVPEEFLNATDTVYPVYVDPTVTIDAISFYYYGGMDYEAIIDTGVYTASYIYDQSTDWVHCVGSYEGEDGGILYRFYDFFEEDGKFLDLTEYQFASASLHFYVESGAAANFRVYPVTATHDLTDTAIHDPDYFDTRYYATDQYVTTVAVDSTAGMREIDITDIVKGWTKYNAGTSTNAYDNPYNGFFMRSDSTTDYRNVGAMENWNYDIYYEVETGYMGGVYYLSHLETGQFLSTALNTNSLLLTTSYYTDSDSIRFLFEYLGNNQYLIRPMADLNYVLYGMFEHVAIAQLTSGDPYTNDNFKWEVEIVGGITLTNVGSGDMLCFDGTNVNMVVARESADTNFEQLKWGAKLTSEYVNLVNFELNSAWLKPWETKPFKIQTTPITASWQTNDCFEWTFSNPEFTVSDGNLVTCSASNVATTLTIKHKPTGVTRIFEIVCGAVPEGTLVFRNEDTGLYAQQDDQGENFLEQHQFDDTNMQKWRFEFEDGYYRIWKYKSSLYLTAPDSTAEDKRIGLQVWDNTIADRQLWRITLLSDGSCIIKAKTWENNNLVLAVGYSLDDERFDEGINIEQRNYAEVGDRGEWRLYGKENCSNVDVNVLYDQAYLNRHSDAYNRVSNAMIKLKERYFMEFGIWLTWDFPRQFYSYMDTDCSTDPDSICSHGIGCENSETGDIKDYHHSNIFNIMYRVPIVISDTAVTVVFTGHIVCYMAGDNHCIWTESGIYSYASGVAKIDLNMVAIMDFGSEEEEQKTLVHEFGHLFGAPDHYGWLCPTTADLNNQKPVVDFNPTCIYGEYRDYTDEVICAGCAHRIKNNADKYSGD